MKHTRFNVFSYRYVKAIATPIIFLLILHSNATAQKENVRDEFGLGSGQIRITANQLVADSEENSAEFSGNVKAVQEDTIITSDHLKLFFRKGTAENSKNPAPDSLLKIVVTGNVEIKFDNRVAVTQEAVYITDEKRLILTGPDTKISSGKDTITGQKITYFREKGRIEVEAGKGHRVEAIIYPGKKSQ